MTRRIKTAYNTGLAKVAVQCSAVTFVVNQSLVLRIKFCGENRHLRQLAKHYLKGRVTRENQTFVLTSDDKMPALHKIKRSDFPTRKLDQKHNI
jgi:hypothetical protein